MVTIEVCYVCLLSSALCTTAGVRVMGLMITAYGLTDATYTPLCEMQSREAHMEAIVGVGQRYIYKGHADKFNLELFT